MTSTSNGLDERGRKICAIASLLVSLTRFRERPDLVLDDWLSALEEAGIIDGEEAGIIRELIPLMEKKARLKEKWPGAAVRLYGEVVEG